MVLASSNHPDDLKEFSPSKLTQNVINSIYKHGQASQYAKKVVKKGKIITNAVKRMSVTSGLWDRDLIGGASLKSQSKPVPERNDNQKIYEDLRNLEPVNLNEEDMVKLTRYLANENGPSIIAGDDPTQT